MSTVYIEIRLLLTLWDMGSGQGLVKKSELLKNTRKSKDKESYEEILQSLIDAEAISQATEKKTVIKVALTDSGLQKLAAGLIASDFAFQGQLVGSRLANAGLNWFRQNQGLVVDENVVTEAIASDSSTDESVVAEG